MDPRMTSERTPTSLERRPSGTTAHYRQPSKAHGGNSQSRNAIFVTAPTPSPMSPEFEPLPDVSVVPDFNTMMLHGPSRRRPSASPSTAAQGSLNSTPTTLVADGDASGAVSTMKRPGRTPSTTRKDNTHHRSRSRNAQKDAGSYGMQHLFNKVSVDE